MTDRPAVIRGTYSDLKIIKGRKVAVLHIEVPLELGKQITDAFGLPDPHDPIWVAVARLDMSAKAEPEKPKPPAKRSQIAALKCQDDGFRRFVARRLGMPGNAMLDPERCADKVREYCNVESRRELDTDPDAAQAWDELVRLYEQWRDQGMRGRP